MSTTTAKKRNSLKISARKGDTSVRGVVSNSPAGQRIKAIIEAAVKDAPAVGGGGGRE